MASNPVELPFITIYPPDAVRNDIRSTGQALYDNLINTWIIVLKFYSSSLVPSPSLRNFLESYLQESTRSLLPDPKLADPAHQLHQRDHLSNFLNRIKGLDEIDRTLRAAVFSLLISHPEDDSKKLPFLDTLSYPALYSFIKLYGPTNLKSVQKCLDTLYSVRGGRPFANSLMATALAEPLTPFDASVIGNIILPSSSLLAKDWVTPKWFFSLENLYSSEETGDYARQSIIDTVAASFLVSLSVLDSNTKIKVLSDIISRTKSSSSQYHLFSALLNFTNFSSLVGVPSLTVSLETAKLRLPKVPYPGSTPKKSKKSKSKSKNTGNTPKSFSPQEKEQINSVRDLFPQLSEKVVYSLLQKHENSAEIVTSYLLENMDEIDRLASQLDSDLVIEDKQAHSPAPPPANSSSSASNTTKQRSIYEGDELSNLNITKGKLIFGKKDFSLGKKESLQTALERIYNAEEDEHDDTYDETEGAIKHSIQSSNPSGPMSLVADSRAEEIETKVNRRSKNNTKKIEQEEEEAEKEYATQLTSVSGEKKPTEAESLDKFLWEHYERSPTAFLRSARRTRMRAEIKSVAKMTDEQLEGWARMLDREPKRKERMAARYSFTGFVPLPARNNAKKPDPEEDEIGEEFSDDNKPKNSSKTGGQSNRRNRAPQQPRNSSGISTPKRQNDSGTATPKRQNESGTATPKKQPESSTVAPKKQPESSSSAGNERTPEQMEKDREYAKKKERRDQRRKEQNKASRANHNRKSGHDKKMAKVGAFS